MSLHLFAGLRVRDFQAARAWYERLLGEPAFFPHATEAVWTLAEDRSVYIVEQAGSAGHSVVTLFVDDLDAHVAAIAARGLEPDERETYSNGVRKVLYRDPDGNELGFGGAPLDAGQVSRVSATGSPPSTSRISSGRKGRSSRLSLTSLRRW
jgi:catechol 2,3-dioxygenase-like lactoylglutathione lyase family enzyme